MRPDLRIGSAHLKLAAGFLLAFTLIDAWLLHEMLTERSRVVPSALFAFSGPLVGAFARDWQSCCTAFSLRLLPWSTGILGLAAAFQWIPLPSWRHARAARLLVWSAGLLAWFASGVLSFGHALG